MFEPKICSVRNRSSYSCDWYNMAWQNERQWWRSHFKWSESTDSATIQCLGVSDAENEDFSEVNENEKHIVNMDIMLDNYDPTVPACDELLSSQEIMIAPGEGRYL